MSGFTPIAAPIFWTKKETLEYRSWILRLDVDWMAESCVIHAQDSYIGPVLLATHALMLGSFAPMSLGAHGIQFRARTNATAACVVPSVIAIESEVLGRRVWWRRARSGSQVVSVWESDQLALTRSRLSVSKLPVT